MKKLLLSCNYTNVGAPFMAPFVIPPVIMSDLW